MRTIRFFSFLVVVLTVGGMVTPSGPQAARLGQQAGGGRGAAPPAPVGAAGVGEQAPAIPNGTGFIAGQVIDVPSGKPVAEAIVSLGGTFVVNGRPIANRIQIIADSQGRFVFGSLAAGTFTMSASAPGYLPPRAAPQVFVQLAEGEKMTGARVRLTRVASLSGVLRDEAGDPVVGTDVLVLRREVITGRATLVAAGKTRSDDRGMYRVGGLPPGDYLVCACSRDPIPIDPALLTTIGSDPVQLVGVGLRALSGGSDVVSIDSTLRTYAPTFHPNSLTASRATRVALASGEDKSRIDLNLEAVRATRVSGAVIGATGPVQASSMRLFAAGENEIDRDLFSLPPILVQPDGRFDFAMVPPGQYKLLVAHRETGGRGGPSGVAMNMVGRGGSTVEIPVATMSNAAGAGPSDAPYLWANETLTVGDKGLMGVSVTLNRAAMIAGRVQWVGAAPQPTAQMLTRATAQWVLSSGDFTAFTGPVNGRIAPDATFTGVGALPGKYSLNPLPLPGYPTLKSVVVGGTDMTDLPIEVSDKDITDVIITYVDTPMAALTLTTNPAPGPAPFEDAWALVFSVDRKFWADPYSARRRFRQTALSAKGVATMDGLPAGEYFVLAGKSADAIDWQDAAKLDALSRRAQRISVNDGEKKTIEVRR